MMQLIGMLTKLVWMSAVKKQQAVSVVMVT